MNVVRQVLHALFVLSAITAAAQAAPFVCVGGTGWYVSANGYTGTMDLGVDSAGNVTGTFLRNPVKGFWNDAAGKLTFYRAIGGTLASTPPEQIQIYTGYSFGCSLGCPSGTWYLEGYFESFAGTGATATKNLFGWSASCISIE